MIFLLKGRTWQTWSPFLFSTSLWQKRGTWTEQHIIAVQNSSGTSFYKEKLSRVSFCCIHDPCYVYLCAHKDFWKNYFFTYITLKAKSCATYDEEKLWFEDNPTDCDWYLFLCWYHPLMCEYCLNLPWGKPEDLAESWRLGAQLEIQRCFPMWSCTSGAPLNTTGFLSLIMLQEQGI